MKSEKVEKCCIGGIARACLPSSRGTSDIETFGISVQRPCCVTSESTPPYVTECGLNSDMGPEHDSELCTKSKNEK